MLFAMLADSNERIAVASVAAALIERFPNEPPEVVEALVRREHATLTGPVRDFVPLLVHKAALGVLRERFRVASAPVRLIA